MRPAVVEEKILEDSPNTLDEFVERLMVYGASGRYAGVVPLCS